MEDCNAMHLCWTISLLHRQKLILASAKQQPIWDFVLRIVPTFQYWNIVV